MQHSTSTWCCLSLRVFAPRWLLSSFCLFLQQSISLTDDPHAWPGLPGGVDSTSGNVTTNPSSAETSETEGDGLQSRRTSLSRGTTMAVKLAQASSGKEVSKEKEQPKKLTPLPGRHRNQASLDSSGLPSVAGESCVYHIIYRSSMLMSFRQHVLLALSWGCKSSWIRHQQCNCRIWWCSIAPSLALPMYLHGRQALASAVCR